MYYLTIGRQHRAEGTRLGWGELIQLFISNVSESLDRIQQYANFTRNEIIRSLYILIIETFDLVEEILFDLSSLLFA